MVNSDFLQCAGCEKPIFDRYLMNVLDRSWHASCVKCYECKISLKDKCFSRGGKLYCKEDFFRIFGTKCAGCTTGISPDDLVRRARGRVFHLKCFTCMVCRRQLSTGEELYVVDGSQFMCKEDYISTVQDGISGMSLESISEGSLDGEGMSSPLPDTDDINYSSDLCNNETNNFNSGFELNSSTAQTIKAKGIIKKKPLKPKKTPKKPQPEFDVNEDSLDLPSSPLSNDSDRSDAEDSPEKSNGKDKDDDDDNDKSNLASKRRGPRTTIKAKQYEMLRASFVATPKPTRQIREQLANDTGLTMRVIQVWFQNRRSKERRMKTISAFGKQRNAFRGSSKRSRSNGVPQDESSNLMNGYEYSEDDRLHYSNNNVHSFRELLDGKELGSMNCDSLSSPGCNTQNDNMNSNESASGFRDSPYSSQDIPVNGMYSMPFQNSDLPFQSDSVLSSPSDSGLTSQGYGLTRTEISSEMW